LTHETTLPFFGLSLPWSQIPLKEHLSEIFTHIIFGMSVELVRRLVRASLFALPFFHGGMQFLSAGGSMGGSR
jgi:uncharacterized membrane protein YagU involved in acid resistance